MIGNIIETASTHLYTHTYIHTYAHTGIQSYTSRGAITYIQYKIQRDTHTDKHKYTVKHAYIFIHTTTHQMHSYLYIHTYTHNIYTHPYTYTYIHTYIHATTTKHIYRDATGQSDKHSDIMTGIYTYNHTTYIHTNKHTYIHAYMQQCRHELRHKNK